MATYLARFVHLASFVNTPFRLSTQTYTADNVTTCPAVNEFLIESPGDDMGQFIFAVNQIANASRELVGIAPHHVSVFEVKDGQKVDRAASCGMMNIMSAVSSHGTVTQYTKTDIYTATDWYIENNYGGRFRYIFTPVYEKRGEYFQMFSTGGYGSPINRQTGVGISTKAPALYVTNNCVKGIPHRMVYRGALGDGDYCYLGTNKYAILSSGAFAFRKWKRYKRMMTAALPYLSNKVIDKENKIASFNKRTGKLTPSRAVSLEAKYRRTFERDPAHSYYTDLVLNMIGNYSALLASVTQQKLNWSHNIWHEIPIVTGIISCVGTMEDMLEMLISLSDTPRTLKSVTGVNPTFKAPNIVIARKGRLDGDFDIEYLIQTVGQYIAQVVGTPIASVLNASTAGIYYAGNFDQQNYPEDKRFKWYVGDTFYEAHTLNQRWIPLVSQLDNVLSSFYMKWHETVFSFNRFLAFAEASFKYLPVYGKTRSKKGADTAPYRVSGSNNFMWSGGRVGSTQEVPGRAFTPASIPNPLEPYHAIESVPQAPPAPGTQYVKYGFQDYDRRRPAPKAPPLPDKDPPEDEEDDGGEFQYWDNEIYPLTPEEEEEETKALEQQITDNLGYVADGALTVAVLLDPMDAPAASIERTVIKDALRDGVKAVLQ